MTVKNVIDFYFMEHEEMMVKVEMQGGIEGKYHKVTKDGFYELFGDWNNETVTGINYETCGSHWYNGKREYTKRDLPVLYIRYM